VVGADLEPLGRRQALDRIAEDHPGVNGPGDRMADPQREQVPQERRDDVGRRALRGREHRHPDRPAERDHLP
jgi:hypothetical protein